MDNNLAPVIKSQQAYAEAAKQLSGVILTTAEEVTDFMEEQKNNLEYMAKLRYIAMEYSGQEMDEWDTSIDYQAAELNQSGVASYHPDHFGSISEFMQSALQGSALGTGAYYRAKNIVEFVIPWCAQNNVSIPSAVLDPGNKSKFGIVGEQAKGVIEGMKAGAISQEDGEAKLKDMLHDTVDPSVTVEQFRQKHQQGRRPKLPAQAWSYMLQDNRTVLIIDCLTTQQYNIIVKLLDGNIDLHLGTGNEEVLNDIPNNWAID